jgi:hypothetical protein
MQMMRKQLHSLQLFHDTGGTTMALINTVSPENAQGVIKEGYDLFLGNAGAIPKPLEMISVSPKLFELQLRRIQYLSRHPKLSFSLLAHIRYLVARSLNYQFCTDFNKHILKKQGVTDDDCEKMEQDPSQNLLEEHEGAMLEFVVRCVKDPTSIGRDDVEGLKKMGWEDGDMVDALSQGVSMIDHSIMMQVFQMDQNCMVS